MDWSWITGRIAVGGGIWNAENMAEVERAGITHVIGMQLEFDDRPLAEGLSVQVLWNPIDDDFLPKPPDVFRVGVEFAREALDQDGSRILIHCAAGVHRAPMMALALLCSLGWKFMDAVVLIESRRPVVDFPEVYLNSVREFLAQGLSGNTVVAGKVRRGEMED
jgi:protein-tyrosine phosphatase